MSWCTRLINVCNFVYALVSCVLTFNICRAIKEFCMCPENGKAKIVCLTVGKKVSFSQHMCRKDSCSLSILFFYSKLLSVQSFLSPLSLHFHSLFQWCTLRRSVGCLSFIPSSVNTTQTALHVTYNCFLLLEFSAAFTNIHLTWPGIITCHFRTYLC